MGKMIVVEGPDASGKSTLISHMAWHMPLHVQVSEGPPRRKGEMQSRILAYFNNHDDQYYDRHPIISEAIYGQFRENPEIISKDLTAKFYDQRPFLIYCRNYGLDHEVRSEVDTKEHLKLITRHEQEIVEAYDKWALEHAHFIYRVGDRIGPLISAIKRYIDA